MMRIFDVVTVSLTLVIEHPKSFRPLADAPDTIDVIESQNASPVRESLRKSARLISIDCLFVRVIIAGKFVGDEDGWKDIVGEAVSPFFNVGRNVGCLVGENVGFIVGSFLLNVGIDDGVVEGSSDGAVDPVADGAEEEDVDGHTEGFDVVKIGLRLRSFVGSRLFIVGDSNGDDEGDGTFVGWFVCV